MRAENGEKKIFGNNSYKFLLRVRIFVFYVRTNSNWAKPKIMCIFYAEYNCQKL